MGRLQSYMGVCKQTLSLVGLDNGAFEAKSWRVERLDIVTRTQIASAGFLAVSFWEVGFWLAKQVAVVVVDTLFLACPAATDAVGLSL